MRLVRQFVLKLLCRKRGRALWLLDTPRAQSPLFRGGAGVRVAGNGHSANSSGTAGESQSKPGINYFWLGLPLANLHQSPGFEQVAQVILT